MDVPIRLVRRAAPRPTADAFLLPAADPAPLAAAAARLADWPQVFAAGGGFLLVPPAAEPGPVPGAVRLCRLWGDLFAPADADLLPALLPDEAAALTRDRGLIVLPGGTVVAFDPAAPLPVTRWLAPARVRRAEWEPLPRRPERPDRLLAVERPVPPDADVAEVLGGGAPDDAAPLPGPGEGAYDPVPESARPPAGSFGARAAARAGLTAGALLAWLGKQLGAEGLARAGGDLARRALRAVPRLSERVLGAQEAALRAVLRDLQSGDVEKGLRHAPPAVTDPGRPAHIGTDARLTARDPRYSLRALVGTGGGVASLWLGGGDVWAELAREYRRLAAEAAARGDHRRAAYLYGVLLRDLRAAVNSLLAGGLFHDAALLLRDRLNDPRGAADAFDRAGDHDEAVRLYDRTEQFERAGDVLRRLGAGGRAAGYYARAAEQLAAGGRFLAAGDLMRQKAHLREPAAALYRRGWHDHGAEAVACAERLLDEHLAAGDRRAAEALWAEVEDALADRPRDAGRFFNYALRVGEEFLPADAHADLADRARLLFAAHLRARATIGEAGPLVAELFPAARPWPPAVGRDASFVVRARAAARPVRPPPHPHDWSARQLIRGTVQAVALVRGTFDAIVAAGDGNVVRWCVSDDRVVPVCAGRGSVAAVAASARGESVYALARRADDGWRVFSYAADRAGTYLPIAQYPVPTEEGDDGAVFLQPAAVFRSADHRLAVVTPERVIRLIGPYLGEDPDELVIDERPVRLLVDGVEGYLWHWAGSSVTSRGPGGAYPPLRWQVGWTPAGVVDWLTPAAGVLEIAAVDGDGGVHWGRYDGRDPGRSESGWAFDSGPLRYSVACLVAPGVVAAVTTGNDICWLRVAGTKLAAAASTPIGGPARVVGLTARPDPSELAVVLADGSGLRVRRP